MIIKLYFSDFFEVDPDLLENYGAFNVSLINDLPLFIDPFLLFNSSKEKYQELHTGIINYVKFLRDVSIDANLKPGLLRNWFIFSEVKQTWLGYSLVGNEGRGLGVDFAEALNRNLRTIFNNFGSEQITLSSHLEKLCLIKDGIGKDNISDFVTNLIKEFILEYTENFAVQHIKSSLRRRIKINKVKFNYQTRTWESRIFDLPFIMDDYVLLTPKEILTKDDTWISSTELKDRFLDIADAIPNDQLRDQVSDYFLQMLPDRPKRKEFHAAVIQTVDRYPEILDYYIRLKEETGYQAEEISKEKVEEIESLFIRHASDFVQNLAASTEFYKNPETSYNEALNRISYLKDVIENKDGYKIFYLESGTPIKREVYLQILFKLVWYGTIFDVNSEVNNGRGPVDFKISKGSKDKTLVEFKLASNSKIKQNLEHQVQVYEKANNTKKSIKVIIYFSEGEYRKIKSILNDLKLSDDSNIIIINARRDDKISASNVKN